MNIYYNDYYVAPIHEFETTKKAKYIVESLKNNGFNTRDPKEKLEIANSIIGAYTNKHYLQAIKTGNNRKLAQTNGFNWDYGIYEMVANSTAGILMAIDDVVNGSSVACSLSSGLHHATPSRGKGFCTINSLALGAIYASIQHNKRVTILDLDAHCGGGTYEFIKEQRLKGNNNIKQIDICIEPFDSYSPTAPTDVLHVFENWTEIKDEEYLMNVAQIIRENISPDNTDIVLYNAGVDIYPQLTENAVKMRDLYVSQLLKDIPTVVVLAGGYGKMESVVELHQTTIELFDGHNSPQKSVWSMLAN
jgi:acetoin utilization deacetylase AcuC-like enzyme